MSYLSGGLIQLADYNSRITGINNLWSTGQGSNGYGQTALGSASASSIVTATQWSTLISTMSTMQQHQFNNTTGIPASPSAGSIITYLSAVDTEISSLITNKLTTAAAGTSLTTAASLTTSWDGHATRTFNLTFPSADQLRYFFNAGGYIQLNFTGTSLSGNNKSTYWNTFLTTGFGTYTLRAASSSYTGTGFTPATNLASDGYYNLSNNAFTTLFKMLDSPSSADYTNNFIQVDFAGGGTSTNGGFGASLIANVTLRDAAADVVNDQVTGTLTCNMVVIPPWDTTHNSGKIANSWGTYTCVANVNTQGTY